YKNNILFCDHRKIAKQMDLYHIQEEAPGMIFWHNNGLIIFKELEKFIRLQLKKFSYQEVKCPSMMDKNIWKITGHWDNYSNNIFTTSSENREYCIKPMNCPGHIQIFNQTIQSYRNLPLRIAEFGSCHRNEPSGSLYGLMRIRNFTQDDAHIFCTEEQIYDEISNCIKMIYHVYNIFGFKNIKVKLSTRPKYRIGDDNTWNWAEKKLVDSLKGNNIIFDYQLGDGAFYGPKIEFILLDSLGRFWQCGTIQLDFFLPNRLDAYYINKNNTRSTPIMIHRSILGSIERFIGIITEEYAGFYPVWLAPIQVVITNISINQYSYVNEIGKILMSLNIRTKIDTRNKKLGFKIREYIICKIPYIIVCGNEEISSKKLSVRTSKSKNFYIISINNFIEKIKYEISNYLI
ncbi:MAG: threonine--tRNA ligase, partial [Candidatus Lightella neohaematopini]|nr:threonine--tRNA ligase [Candidatus Lightella neohaematopini]